MFGEQLLGELENEFILEFLLSAKVMNSEDEEVVTCLDNQLVFMDRHCLKTLACKLASLLIENNVDPREN